MLQPNVIDRTTSGERKGGWIRSADQLDDLRPGEFLRCHSCREEFDRHDAYRLDLTDREHMRCPCGKSGFILGGSKRNQSIAGRRPMLSGLFYPSAMELRTYGKQLGLDGIDRLVVEAIDDFPADWDLTYELIAGKADIKPRRVKDVLKKLRDKKLIESEHVYFNGNRTGARYNLEPLWNALAEMAAANVNERETDDSVVTTGVERPKTTGVERPNPLDVLSSRDLSSKERERAGSQERNPRVSSLASSKPQSSTEGVADSEDESVEQLIEKTRAQLGLARAA